MLSMQSPHVKTGLVMGGVGLILLQRLSAGIVFGLAGAGASWAGSKF